MVPYSPPINIVEDFVGFCFAICNLEVLANPGHKVVLENTFYDLVKEIWCQHFVDICVRIVHKWL